MNTPHIISPGQIKWEKGLKVSWVLLLIFMLPSLSIAAEETVNTRLQGTDLFDIGGTSSTLDASDDKYWMIEGGFWTNEFAIQSVKNKITFGIDESDLEYHSTAYSYRLTMDITIFELINGVLDSTVFSGLELDINYDPASGATYKDRDVYAFTGGLKVKIKVTAIEYEATPGSGSWSTASSLKDAIFLENEVTVERYYHFDQYDIPDPTLNLDTLNGELIVTWPWLDGAEEYELEWTWVNAYTGNLSGSTPVVQTDLTQLSYDFVHNASSVRVQGRNTYSIPLIYGDGYILLRYRGIGRDGDNYQVPIEGTWSSDALIGGDAGLVSNYGTQGVNFERVYAHESHQFNYGAGMSFIEDGVRSVGVTYMDGVLKPRQSQAKLNSQNKIIVGSTIYDHHGRPAVGVMSAPIDQNRLGYVDNLNMYDQNTPYGKAHFDLDQVNPVDACGTYIPADTMSATYSLGAAHYYSDENTDIEGFNAYLPDAEGYPFVHVQYTPDGTGRIKRVGGLGPDHQLGETDTNSLDPNEAHYTEYFYDLPDDDELWELFGNDAAKVINYTKVITKDVHGQFSIALIDGMGRTVATYMEGTAPVGLEAIEGNDGPNDTGKDFMAYNDTFTPGIVQVETQITVLDPSVVYTFNYDVTGTAFTECLPSGMCFDCVYELDIMVIPHDAASGEITDGDAVSPIVISDANGVFHKTYTLGKIEVDSFNVDCADSALVFSEEFPSDSTWNMQFCSSGTYQIIKTLKVANDPIDYYWEAYKDSSTCLTPYSDFLATALSQIDLTACDEYEPCEFNFLIEYGTDSVWLANNPGEDSTTYDSLRTAYLDDCGTLSSCEAIKPLLILDMSPGGQYGETDTTDNLSVFNASNNDLGGHWKMSSLTYYDQYGNQSFVCADNDGIYDDDPQDLTTAEFFNAWQPSWAETLIQYHPEFCYYDFCDQYPGIADFEQDFMDIGTYAEACNSGYVNPAEQAGYFDISSTCTTDVADPLFEDAYDDQTGVQTAVDSIMNDKFDGWPIYSAAVGMSGDDTTSVDFGEGCNADLHWKNFKLLYMSKRFQVLELIKEDYATNNCPDAACVGTSAGACSTSPFSSSTKRYFNFGSTMGYDMANLGTTDWSAQSDSASLEIDTICTDMCTDQADLWMDQLAGCVNDLPAGQTWTAGQPYYDSIRVNLIEVCANGCAGGCMGLTQFDNNVSTDSLNSVYASFEDVLLHYVGSLSNDCTNLLINQPDVNEQCVSGRDYLNKCACEALLAAESDTPSEFETLYGFIPDDFDKEQCLCDSYDANSDNVIDGTELTSLENDSIVTYNTYGFCNSVCIDCAEMIKTSSGLVDEFYSTHSINYYDDPLLFTAYVNNAEGTNFTYEVLLELINGCEGLEGTSTEPIYNFIGQQAHDLADLLEKLAQDNLSTDHTDYDHQNLPEYFYSSLYADCTGDPAVEDFDYDQTIDVNDDLSFNLQGSNCNACTIDIEIIDGVPAGYIDAAEFYGSIISFNEVYVIQDDIMSGGTATNFNVFRVKIIVDDLNGGTSEHVLKITSCHSILDDLVNAVGELYFEICSNEYEPPTGNTCMENIIAQAELSAQQQYEEYLDTQYDLFVENYKTTCMGISDEEFNMDYQANRYHYTLLYYDLSGNLIKTVPPKGVDKLNATEIAQAKDYALNGTGSPIYNAHTYETTYKHNSLNQVVEVSTPDGGTSKYWYDHIGRLVVSQNARQANDFYKGIMTDDYETGNNVDAYSYTVYDEIGRVSEVGEIIQADVMTYAIAKDETDLANWLDDDIATTGSEPVVKNNITLIFYDALYDSDAETEFGAFYNEQTNRNRITAAAVITGYVETTGGSWVYPEPDYINHYNYDVHGNVRSYLQEVAELTAYNNQYRRTDYEYDLISGNPNYIYYQKGKKDQYIHHYRYDKDNRLKEVWTSDDGQIWDRDANYEYREDGYLARTEIGEMKVQGMDYAYTLHGWLKSLNSGVLNPDYDMGKDGKTDPTVEYDNYEDDIHALHARDVLSYTIGYYEGDYKAITDGVTGFTNHLVDISGSAFETDVDELFNGNITSIISSTTKTDGTKQDPLATTYHYDQLHRFKESHVFTSANIIDDQSQYYNTLDDASRINTTGPGNLGEYEVHVEYDPNGNITQLNRMAHGTNMDMDQFEYTYIDGTNKLDTLYDKASQTGAGGFGDIISESKTTGDGIFYEYHSDGSLKADEEEEIDYIDWYPNGKIKRIYRTSTSEQSDVYFEYDPMGMRTLKVEITRTGTTINAADDWKFTYYGCDANGITMAIYDMDSTNGDLHRIESMIYGGSRLGMNTENETVSTADDLINDCNNDGLNSAVIQFGAFTPNNGSVVEIIHESVVISTLTWDTGLTTEEQVQTMVDDINAQASGYTAYNVEVSAGSIYYIHIKEDVAGAFTGDLVVELDDSPQSTYIKREPGIGKCFEDRILGSKFYELVNHLGSPLEIISDRKIAVDDNTDDVTDWFEADVVSYSEYFPYHMLIPGRHGKISGGNYRFGGAGMEKDDEVSGEGNSYTTQFRQYDPRLGRWKSLDPLAAKFPWQSPFVAFANDPIYFIDPLGLEQSPPEDKDDPDSDDSDAGIIKKFAKKLGINLSQEAAEELAQNLSIRQSIDEIKAGKSVALSRFKKMIKDYESGKLTLEDGSTVKAKKHSMIDKEVKTITEEKIVVKKSNTKKVGTLNGPKKVVANPSEVKYKAAKANVVGKTQKAALLKSTAKSTISKSFTLLTAGMAFHEMTQHPENVSPLGAVSYIPHPISFVAIAFEYEIDRSYSKDIFYNAHYSELESAINSGLKATQEEVAGDYFLYTRFAWTGVCDEILKAIKDGKIQYKHEIYTYAQEHGIENGGEGNNDILYSTSEDAGGFGRIWGGFESGQ
ncbi:MAG: hypothetical protein WDZ35_11230 [Crocinitomicaceae bacterium]